MGNYKEAYKKIMKYEGGYSNDPADIGGETFKGVARVYHPDWCGWKIIDSLKISSNGDMELFKKLLETNTKLNDMVIDFYKPQFWDRFRGDDITSQAICDELYDIAINLGYKRANKFFQIALNVMNKSGKLYQNILMDGVVGNKTIEIFNIFMQKSGDVKTFLKILNILQGNHYINRMLEDESQEKFCVGWLSRVEIDKL